MFAGLFGSQLVIATKDIWPQYLLRRQLPHPGRGRGRRRRRAVAAARAAQVATHAPPEGRPLTVLFRQPRLIVAVLCGVASYSMMNLIMTSAPIAMIDCNTPSPTRRSGCSGM